VVHQKRRPKGWKLPDGTYLNFEAVIQRLRDLAIRIRSESPAGPQPEICVVDVSSCARRVGRRQSAPKQSASADWLGFYNARRLHSTLDYVSPMTFEKKWLAA
jgi:transposase InsO family protein